MIHIRRAIEADLDQVAAVWLAGWQATGLAGENPPAVTDLRHRLDVELAGDWTLDVACVDGRIVGMLATGPDRIDQLFLEPAWIGKGVGHALFAHAQARLPAGLTLWTQPANGRARAFYEAHGMRFERIDRHPHKDERIAVYGWPIEERICA